MKKCLDTDTRYSGIFALQIQDTRYILDKIIRIILMGQLAYYFFNNILQVGRL